MRSLTLEALAENADAFDDAVAATDDIDHFCSSSLWVLPAESALMPRRQPWVYDCGDGYIALMRGRHPQGWRYLEPLEAMWGLACPLLGSDEGLLVEALVELCRSRDGEWELMLLCGVPDNSMLLKALVDALSPHYRLVLGQRTRRQVANLRDGLDAFIGNRSRNFRKNLRRAVRESEAVGIDFETHVVTEVGMAQYLYQRAVAVERRSWKGRAGVGIDRGSMHAFYREMVPRLAARGQLRMGFARHQGRDIGFILGAVFGTGYRGLQFSFDAEYGESSVGNVCQYQQIAALCAEGIESYDLGTDMEYKRRWADFTHDSVAILVTK